MALIIKFYAVVRSEQEKSKPPAFLIDLFLVKPPSKIPVCIFIMLIIVRRLTALKNCIHMVGFIRGGIKKIATYQ